MTTYAVVSERELDAFLDEVDKHLDDGWQLQGGVCAVVVPPDGTPGDFVVYRYFQAMTKTEEAA